MTAWQEEHKIIYAADSDENIDSAFQKVIAETARIYELLNRLRTNDLKNGDPDDTTAWQFHVDSTKNELYVRNPKDTAWISLGKLNTAGDRFIFDRAVANNGGVPSIQYGLIASRPAEEVDGAVYVATDENKRYRWNGTVKAWDYIDTLITRHSDGKIHVEEADHASEADHAAAATNASYAETVGMAEYSAETGKLKTAVSINGIPFDGSQSIRIPTTGSTDDETAYESLLWRTEQTERELSNIELAIEDSNIYPDYNNLLVENFKSTYDVDQTAVLVTSSAAGDSSINVSSLSQLKVGNLYMLTDGTQSEYVTVAGLIKNGTTYRVTLTANITNVYKDNAAYLYRTTSKVGNGKASGSGITSNTSWNPSLVWSGEGSSVESTVALNTMLGNAGSYASTSGVTYTDGGLMVIKPYTAVGIALINTGNRVGQWVRVNADGDDL